jgi:hypothetical protein
MAMAEPGARLAQLIDEKGMATRPKFATDDESTQLEPLRIRLFHYSDPWAV